MCVWRKNKTILVKWMCCFSLSYLNVSKLDPWGGLLLSIILPVLSGAVPHIHHAVHSYTNWSGYTAWCVHTQEIAAIKHLEETSLQLSHQVTISVDAWTANTRSGCSVWLPSPRWSIKPWEVNFSLLIKSPMSQSAAGCWKINILLMECDRRC